MSFFKINSETLDRIANAINAKTGKTAALTPAQMVTEIGSISGGGGVTPTGTIQIAQNGTYNVTNYASAEVNVSGGGGGATWRQIVDFATSENLHEITADIPNGEQNHNVYKVQYTGSFSTGEYPRPMLNNRVYSYANSNGIRSIDMVVYVTKVPSSVNLESAIRFKMNFIGGTQPVTNADEPFASVGLQAYSSSNTIVSGFSIKVWAINE